MTLSDADREALHAQYHGKEGCPFYPPAVCPNWAQVDRIAPAVERIRDEAVAKQAYQDANTEAAVRERIAAESDELSEDDALLLVEAAYRAGHGAAERALVERMTKLADEWGAHNSDTYKGHAAQLRAALAPAAPGNDAGGEREDEWCREESCRWRHWRSGDMPTHRRGSDCPPAARPGTEGEACHCGEPVAYGFNGDPANHRGMCAACDLVRCDAYPLDCPARAALPSQETEHRDDCPAHPQYGGIAPYCRCAALAVLDRPKDACEDCGATATNHHVVCNRCAYTWEPPRPAPATDERACAPCGIRHPKAGCADVGCTHNCESWVRATDERECPLCSWPIPGNNWHSCFRETEPSYFQTWCSEHGYVAGGPDAPVIAAVFEMHRNCGPTDEREGEQP